MNRRAPSILLAVVVFLLASHGTVWAGDVTDSGHRLPMPFGVGMSVYNQAQPYDIKTLSVDFPGLDLQTVEGIEIDNTTTSMHVRFDYWLARFFNIFVLGGAIDGTTTVDLGNVDTGLPIRLNDISIDLSGFMYGAGATLAVGGKGWFGSLTYQINQTDLDVSSSTVQGQVITPKIGMTFKGAAIWVGAMYQIVEETHEGIWSMPFLGDVPYYVELEQKQPWNYQIGMAAGLSEHWILRLEGGFGDRMAALANIEYRFGKRR